MDVGEHEKDEVGDVRRAAEGGSKRSRQRKRRPAHPVVSFIDK